MNLLPESVQAFIIQHAFSSLLSFHLGKAIPKIHKTVEVLADPKAIDSAESSASSCPIEDDRRED